jgi:hypothetical protein
MALKVHITLEIMGRPPENVKEALNTLVVRLGSEKGVKILEKTYHEPVPIKESKDLHTAFAEILLELESLSSFFGIIFAYMPSHIEIIEPEKLSITNFDMNSFGNSLTQRLHEYDAITKKMIFEREMALRKLKEVAPELFKKESKTLEEEISKNPTSEKKPKKAKKSKKN